MTPENNAAVLLQQAFGPSDIKDSLRPKFYELLGIKPLPEKGEYFVDETEMLKRWRAGRGALGIPVSDDDAEKMSDEFDRAQERPWTAKEFPIVAEWLALNEKPLALIEQASRRPNCYSPFVAGDAEPPILGGLLLPHLELLGSAAEALVTRAMLQTKQGNIDTAWRDLRDCHRLARLAAKGSTFVDALVGFAIDGMAVSGDIAFAHYSHLPAQRVEQMRAELVALPPVTDIVEKLDVGERFMCLDAIASIARNGPSVMAKIASGGEKAKSSTLPDDLVDAYVNWNIPLQTANQWYDRLVTAGRIADRQKRRNAFVSIDNDLEKLAADVKNIRSWAWDFFTKKTPQEVVSPRVGSYIVTLFLPALGAGLSAQDRVDLCSQMDQTAFALAAYRADHGSYPEKLDLLVPKYLEKVPIDTFSPGAAPIRYRRGADAYLIWSVHLNGVDDDGRNYDDDPPGDDWVLRPVPREAKAN